MRVWTQTAISNKKDTILIHEILIMYPKFTIELIRDSWLLHNDFDYHTCSAFVALIFNCYFELWKVQFFRKIPLRLLKEIGHALQIFSP